MFDGHEIFPATAKLNEQKHLVLGGCDSVELVQEYGTPLYVYDEDTLRGMCREFVEAFCRAKGVNSKILYAAKAFINPAIAEIVSEEGLGMDVVSAGEIAVALASGFPSERIYFHGNNKSQNELEVAIDSNVSKIVIDNFHEMEILNKVALSKGIVQDALLRVSPGVDPHTHVKTTTGVLDSKFGLSIDTGDAALAISKAMELPGINLRGLHCHLGSPIFELEPYSIAVEAIFRLASQFKMKGFVMEEFSPGGGFAIGYTRGQIPPPIASYAEVIIKAVKDCSKEFGMDVPEIVMEPGRSIVGRAGVALYTVGSTKDIPGVRKYVSLDGGMGDNIRPAMYESVYEASVANRMSDTEEEKVTLAGKFCESGDILVRDVLMPSLKPGDVVAIPASGAYAPSMASVYNLNPRPAIVIVKDGSSRVIRRRETYQDLMLLDVF